MTQPTPQTEQWDGDFGRRYTDRNPHTMKEMDEQYQRNFALTRSELNERFLGDTDRNIRILEVGANIGTQLQGLKNMGFKHLFGIELQQYAIDQAHANCSGIKLIQGTAFDMPFEDQFFDLVFTSGVLIHIAPDDIKRALNEIHRCTSRYIWGYEYFSDSYVQVDYRKQAGLMWKTDFPALYLKHFDDLTLVRQEQIPYLNDDNVDVMFLLEKQQR